MTPDGVEHRYFFHVYNRTWLNERAVELPVVWRYVQECPAGRILEVGNVLSHYFRVRHDILDKYEQAPGVVNEDVVSYRPEQPYDLIVSISTLEHVGWDEEPREEEKVGQALDHLRSLLAPGGRMVITVPLGHNDHLDRLIREKRCGFDRMLFLKRTSADNRWTETSWEEVKDARYGSPYRAANGLVIGIVETDPAVRSPAPT